MRFTSLKLANLRAIETAEFRFQPGFNLIVGVNGVGKSTILDALRICASRILPSITESRAKAMTFTVDDIRTGLPFLDAELSLAIGHDEFRFTRRQWRQSFAADDTENLDHLRREILNSERLADRARTLLRELEGSHGVSDSDAYVPSLANLKKAARSTAIAPNCIYYSTNRSVASNASTSNSRAAGDRLAAYAEALAPRPMYVAQFGAWMRVQKVLGGERVAAMRHLEVLQSAITRFLPSYANLRPGEESASPLVISKGGITLDVSQLSDGERGVLALVLDLARRLSQANPSLADPLADGDAVVLIDEIDLHLHPKWQRQIVRNLTATFPRCQFIATTHSPQVIGEVEHGRIQIIADGKVYSPTHSFGVDSSRVLEEIMDTNQRAHEIDELLSQISKAIGNQRYGSARNLLLQLIRKIGEDDPEVTRIRTLLEFMEGEQ
ncbi:ATP-binding protein [Geothrix rubra]|uniref:ATP-binding protein n=1 Tax=Geothrix rubra TaxID=2927977 RepID=A0ABQ5Q912_9BACT|nr:AAA family ATPase [Geothrix rubra]GLH71319.1 ATP-binding protein [Geothrix rubra]